jgi:enoyl-CoA hydratase/carnithine racemase
VGAEESSLDEALTVERQVGHKVAAGKHQLEGMMAFLEKRKPDFSTDSD